MHKKLIVLFILCIFILCIPIKALAFESDLSGSTGYATHQLDAKDTIDGKTIFKVDPGKSFCIIQEEKDYWLIKYDDKIGYIKYEDCMINLPDVEPSIYYEITNSEHSIFKTSEKSIYGLTGVKLYDFDKSYNSKIDRIEYIVPVTYDTAKLISQAQQLAVKNGYSLKIYDSYRPKSITKLASAKLYDASLVDPDISDGLTVYEEDGQSYYWGSSWFLASTVSTHNCGAAIDVTLVDLYTRQEVKMQSPMHELSTRSVKYLSGGSTQFVGIATEETKLMNTIFTEVGMDGLASEWWHYQDNKAYKRILNSTCGCDFQIKDQCSVTSYEALSWIGVYIKPTPKNILNRHRMR